METFKLIRTLPSCRISKRLIAQMESYLLGQLPKLLKKELANMMELLDLKNPGALRQYVLSFQGSAGTEDLETISNYKKEQLPSTLRRVTMSLKLGRPEILGIRMVFAHRGKPFIEISTASQSVKQNCNKILQHLQEILRSAASRSWLFHHKAFQTLLTLSIPAGVMVYGHLIGKDSILLYYSQGWLLLFSGLLSYSLTKVFPFITFRTDRKVDLKKILYLLLLIATSAGIVGYTWVLLLELGAL